ncbi:MAG: xanthine dehydrogenase family protein subunit M [Anaerolineales bacterium]|nr:xanthine dehydrogenase family protein subunit M [Anaerolineales bacterium]
MQPFEYYAPHSLPEALTVLADYGGAARVIAGGTDLLLKLKAGRIAPPAVVNLKRLPALRGQTVNSHVTLGALTTLTDLHASPQLRARLPSVAAAAGTMASVQIRNLATLGGNLCNAAPSADLAPILIALEAVGLIAGPQGEREAPLEDFFTGPGQTALLPGELLTAVRIAPAAGPSTYLKLAPRACMDIAVVGVGLALQLEGERCRRARIVLGAVGPTPRRARRAEDVLLGERLTPERIAQAADLAAEAAQPIDDVRGSAWYRRRMVTTLTRRGLLALAEAA